jgi:putative Mg2+ transporter-C (MgtC) family protein
MSGPGEWEVVGRLLLAAAVGAALGIEREADGQDAGLRTHLMLALGAAVFGLVSVGGFDAFMTSSDTNVQVDVTRVASYVAAGIGFIGGGAILKQAGGIRGLTTAASLWVAAGSGLAAGLGMWTAALTGTAIALLSLAALKPVGVVVRRIAKHRGHTLTIVLRDGAAASDVLRLVEGSGLHYSSMQAGTGQNGNTEIVVQYEGSEPVFVHEVAERLSGLDDVSQVFVGR